MSLEDIALFIASKSLFIASNFVAISFFFAVNSFNVPLETISSIEVVFFVLTTRSTTETFTVGIRTARPSSFPLSSGITRPTFFAAPVFVGMITNGVFQIECWM